jgi:hypothetical protein
VYIFFLFFLVLPAVFLASCCKNSEELPAVDARKSKETSAEISESVELSLESNRLSAELPFFNFSCMSEATNNFSEENMLGQGRFGPVYKVIRKCFYIQAYLS